MALNLTFYGSIAEATQYWQKRLHGNECWLQASISEREAALCQASEIIDRLNFKNSKTAVAMITPDDCKCSNFACNPLCGCQCNWCCTSVPTKADLLAAEKSQPHEFPRGVSESCFDTEVPEDILRSVYIIAGDLLNGVDPDAEFEALNISSQGLSSVRTTYARSRDNQEHINAGVTSPSAWRLIRPFLRDDRTLRISRVG